MDLFTTAESERDEALELVAANSGDWMPGAIATLRRLRGMTVLEEFTGEELRVFLMRAGHPPPHHHNAWGAFIKQAIRAQLIRPTGRRKNMRTPKSHARSTAIYSWR